MTILWRIFRVFIAILLLPFCVGAAIALYQVILETDSAQMIWATTLGGALFWVLIYIFLPEPKWLYVLGHELTHAVWSIGFGGKLKKMNVSSEGGHVLTTKSNFLTSLAPYFFPLYVVLVIIVFNLGNYFWDWHKYVLVFYFLIGMLYAFHVTLTCSTLKTKQPDLAQEGYIFSAVIIFLGNLLILLVGIPFLTNKINVSASLDLWIKESLGIYNYFYFFASHSGSWRTKSLDLFL
jgi:hypothetical protein